MPGGIQVQSSVLPLICCGAFIRLSGVGRVLPALKLDGLRSAVSGIRTPPERQVNVSSSLQSVAALLARQAGRLVGRLAGMASDMERETVVKQLMTLKLTSFEDRMTTSCLERGGERMLSLAGACSGRSW
jgi:hypothetical protein